MCTCKLCVYMYLCFYIYIWRERDIKTGRFCIYFYTCIYLYRDWEGGREKEREKDPLYLAWKVHPNFWQHFKCRR